MDQGLRIFFLASVKQNPEIRFSGHYLTYRARLIIFRRRWFFLVDFKENIYCYSYTHTMSGNNMLTTSLKFLSKLCGFEGLTQVPNKYQLWI